jgi:hypothetical protein
VHGANEGLNGMIKTFFTAGTYLVKANADLDLAIKDMQNTWSEIEQIAIKYGVAPLSDKK